MKPFVVRTLSGIVFVAVMLAGLLINERLFRFLTTVIAVGMLNEFFYMPRKTGKKLSGWKAVAYYTAGLIYILGGMLLLNLLPYKDGCFSGILPLCFFLLIWSSDVGAYCIGSTLGKRFNSRKMAPSVSPNKTWAGFWGGLALSVIVAALLNSFGLLEMPLIHSLVWAVIISCFGVLGDLLESAWKRHFGVKDSGNIIPGHGGMLDRFDSTLAALPAGTLYLILFNLI